MRCSDGHLYVVKFQNNPQHLRVLANEMLFTRVAELVGLPVPIAQLVEVNEWLIRYSPGMSVQLAEGPEPCSSGVQFGSRYVLAPIEGQVLDWMPDAMVERIGNLSTFAGMLALDKWSCNRDGRQVVFWRRPREHKYKATYIDHGYCFNGGEWTFPDSPLRGVFPWNEVYRRISGWESFEPWLSCIEEMDPAVLYACADEIPAVWYGADRDAMAKLLETLVRRRGRVRELIMDFRNSSRKPFPNWV